MEEEKEMTQEQIKQIVREVIDDIEDNFSETELVIGESMIGGWRDKLETIVGMSAKREAFFADVAKSLALAAQPEAEDAN